MRPYLGGWFPRPACRPYMAGRVRVILTQLRPYHGHGAAWSSFTQLLPYHVHGPRVDFTQKRPYHVGGPFYASVMSV